MATLTVDSLNKVKYSGLDFDTHFDDLRARMQVEFASDFNDFALSSLGIMLLDLVAYGLDSLSFYLDRRATDAYLETARTRKAVARLSRQLGYKIGPAVASSVDVTLAIETPGGFPFGVTVAKGFQLRGPNELIFETAEAVIFAPNSGPSQTAVVPCYEGETVVENFVATGQANQTIELARVPDQKFVVQGSVRVVVNGVLWTESEFLTFDPTNQYEVEYSDEPPTVRFGNGIAGNIPTVGAPITVTYVASRGLTGQVGQDTVTEAVTPLVQNFTTIPLVINNAEASAGGDDPESLTKVKAYAGRVWNSRKVAVTRPDYKALAGSYADPLYGRVAVAQAVSTRSSEQDIYLQNLLHDIELALAPVKTSVEAETAAGRTVLAEMTTLLEGLADSLAAVAEDTSVAADRLATALTSARQQKNSSVEIYNDAADVVSEATGGSSLVSGLSVATANLAIGSGDARVLYVAKVAGSVGAAIRVAHVLGGSLSVNVTAKDITVTVLANSTAAQVATVVSQTPAAVALVDVYASGSGLSVVAQQALTNLGYTLPYALPLSGVPDTAQSDLLRRLDRCKTEAANIQSAATAMQSAFDNNIIQNVSEALSRVNAVGVDLVTPDTGLNELEQARTSLAASVGESGPTATGLYSTFVALDTAVLPMDTTGAVMDSVGETLVALQAHVDTYLSSDCKANLVTVPILTKNAAGFYVAPSLGLQRSLQAYLDARKEVTQTVKVTSGAIYLVGAKVTLRVGVKEGFAESVVRAGVLAVVDGLLKDRDFGADLYVSDITGAVQDGVPGVAYVNVTIDGHYDVDQNFSSAKLDADGNLIIDSTEVISKGLPAGSVTVNTEIAVTE